MMFLLKCCNAVCDSFLAIQKCCHSFFVLKVVASRFFFIKLSQLYFLADALAGTFCF